MEPSNTKEEVLSFIDGVAAVLECVPLQQESSLSWPVWPLQCRQSTFDW